MLKKQLLNILRGMFMIFVIGSLTTVFIINIATIKRIDTVTEENYKKLLLELNTNINHVLQDVRDLAMNISGINSLKEVLLGEDKNSVEKNYEYVMAQQDLGRINSYNSAIKNQYIYYPNEEILLTAKGTFSPEVGYSYFHSQDLDGYEKWLGIVGREDSKDQIISFGEEIMYIRRLFNYSNENYANIVINLNADRFNGLIEENILHSLGEVYVLKENKMIYSNQETDKEVMGALTDMPLTQESITIEKGKDEITLGIISQGIEYIIIIPNAIVYKEGRIIQKMFLIFTVVSLSYMIIALWFIDKKYNFIMDLIKKISFSLEETRAYGEIEYIERLITQVKKQKRSSKHIRMENTLRKALNGVVSSREDEETELSGGLRDGTYVVVNIRIEDQQGVDSKLVEFIIENVCADTFGEKYDLYTMDYYRGYVLIIYVNTKEQEYIYEEIIHRVNIARKFIEEDIGISCVMALSNVHTTLNRLNKAYKESVEALQYRMLFKEEKVVTYESVIREDAVFYDLKKEIEFVKQIKNGEIDQALNTINKMFKEYFEDREPSLKNTNEIIQQLRTSISGVCMELGMDNTQYHHEELMNMTIEQIKAYFQRYLQAVADYIGENKAVEKNDKVENIMNYVAKHYCKRELTVSSIAEEFDMKISYLSRFYKDHTGDTLLQYINRLRVDKSKELLISTDLNLNQIAEQVGLLNNVALIRTFKKYELMTPSEYRDLNKKG